MEQIKSLYDGINFGTIPKVILKELRQFSNIRSSVSTRNAKGIMEKVEGDFINPMFIYFSEYNFYLNEVYYNELLKNIDLEICYDEKGDKINRKNIKTFFKEYGKGFITGYNEFESNTKKPSSLFIETNEQISYKIYSRIKEHFIYNKNGNFKIEAPIKNEKVVSNINFTFLFKKKNFFESGFYGGEFYKAWEIILNNPTIFEPIFIKAKLENEKTKNGKSSEFNKNPYPYIFINEDVYKGFMKYLNKHIIDFHKDYSFLKKRLMSDKLIYDIKDNAFVKFLYEDLKCISEKNYEDYQSKFGNQLSSKCYSVQRENNYNNIFEKLFP